MEIETKTNYYDKREEFKLNRNYLKWAESNIHLLR